MSDADCKCDDCGRFMNPLSKGVSTARMYDFVSMTCDYDHYRCKACTEKLGPVRSNAKPSDGDMRPYQSHNI